MATTPPDKKTTAKAPATAKTPAGADPNAGENDVELDPTTGRPVVPAKAMAVKDVAKLAEEYMVPFSAQAIRSLFKGQQKITPEQAAGFEAYIKLCATGLYPQLAPQINQGLKTAYLLDPYRQAAKMVLGQNFEPNFETDPQVRTVLAGQVDPVTNRARMMTIDEWTQYLKTNPAFGWAQTPQGQQAQQQVLSGIGQGFAGSSSEAPGQGAQPMPQPQGGGQ